MRPGFILTKTDDGPLLIQVQCEDFSAFRCGGHAGEKDFIDSALPCQLTGKTVKPVACRDKEDTAFLLLHPLQQAGKNTLNDFVRSFPGSIAHRLFQFIDKYQQRAEGAEHPQRSLKVCFRLPEVSVQKSRYAQLNQRQRPVPLTEKSGRVFGQHGFSAAGKPADHNAFGRVSLHAAGGMGVAEQHSPPCQPGNESVQSRGGVA